MAVNVNGAAGYVAARSLCVTSTGRLWQATSTGSGTIELWYSDDSGGSWTRNTSADITGVSANTAGELFIDQDDHAHICYRTTSDATVSYRRMASIGTGTSWSSASGVQSTPNGQTGAMLVAHREGTGWKAHVVVGYLTDSTNYQVVHYPVTITSGGTITVGGAQSISANDTNAKTVRGLDFHHTQSDITAVQSSTPHLYVAWDNASATYFAKAAYSSGAWTWGTVRSIDATKTPGRLIFDGTRVLITVKTAASTPTHTLYERDSADTTTTTRTMTGCDFSSTAGVTYNTATQDVYLVGENTAGNSVGYKAYTRATDTWGSQTVIEAEAVTHNTVTVRRGGLFVLDVAWDGASSIRFEHTSIASPPTAATWVTPADNAAADVGAALVLDWAFVDPLPGDTQGAYAMRRQIGAGTLYYWKAADSSWNASEQKNTTATTTLTLASGWGADGDANHKLAVKTWDAADSEGVYSAELTVVPSTPSNPTLTTPASAGTVVTATLTAAWTVTSQSTYLVELLNSAGTTVLWTSGVVSSTSDRTKVVDYSLVNGSNYQCRLTTVNAEGLAAAAVTHAFNVTYTPPATPTLTATANSTLGKITITPTHPTPSGGQPTVTSIDIFVRCVTGRTYPSGERPISGDGIRVVAGQTGISTAWIDWACASGVAYEYKVRGWAANGTYSDSAWTA